jgi:hypothetical protein
LVLQLEGDMTVRYDLLVYLALLFVVIGFIWCAGLVVRTPDQSVDLETRKLRFAAATFAGILMLFVFVATLYFAGEPKQSATNPGKEIFDKGLTAMFTLAGAIVGYLFGTGKLPPQSFSASQAPSTPTEPAATSPSGRGATSSSRDRVMEQLERKAQSIQANLTWKTSIVDLLKLLDLDSSSEARAKLASLLGAHREDINDSAQFNSWLHGAVLDALANNGGQVPNSWR